MIRIKAAEIARPSSGQLLKSCTISHLLHHVKPFDEYAELAVMEHPARVVVIDGCSVTGAAVRHAHVLPTPWNLVDGCSTRRAGNFYNLHCIS